MKKLLSSLLILVLVLSGCGKSGSSNNGLKEYHDYEVQNSEVNNFNYLTTNQAVDIRVAANFVDALLEYNPNGDIQGCLAKEWSSNDDATEWTFTLRDGLKWVTYDGTEYADVTADDFVAAAKYILTADNASNNANNLTAFLVGAQEYYDASKEGKATDELFEKVGIEAVDEKTIKYTLVAPKPYFDSVVTYISWFPVCQKFLDEIGVENFGIDKDKILYNGCYLLSEYSNGAYKTYTKNANYWDKDNVPFDKVTVTMIESLNKAYEMYQTGELDRAVLTQDQITAMADEDQMVETRSGARSYQIYFNYDKADDPNWNKAVANLAFRQAWFYGFDSTDYRSRTNPNNPDSLINNTYTSAVVVKDSKGTLYGDFEELKDYANGNYNEEKFKEAKKQAMEELTAQGVTFPVTVTTTYQTGNQTAEETYQVLKASIEESLGTDFVVVEGLPYVKSSTTEVTNKKLQSISISGWALDYADPYDYLRHMTDTDDGYMNHRFSHMSDPEYDQLVAKANAMTSLDERYHAFAEAEVYYLEHAYSIPLMTDGHEIQVTKVNDYTKPLNFTSVGKKIKFWETKEDGYTKEEYEAFEKNAK